jgi:hypothetical protein
MIEPTLITWLIGIFGAVTFLPLITVQFGLLLKPNSRQIKDIIIEKGEDWRDRTHFKYALAFAYADVLIILPLFILGTFGVIIGQLWGYMLWFALAVLSIYFSILFWLLEREYVYPSCGRFAYYTYLWGFFLYWGIIVVVYSILKF